MELEIAKNGFLNEKRLSTPFKYVLITRMFVKSTPKQLIFFVFLFFYYESDIKDNRLNTLYSFKNTHRVDSNF